MPVAERAVQKTAAAWLSSGLQVNVRGVCQSILVRMNPSMSLHWQIGMFTQACVAQGGLHESTIEGQRHILIPLVLKNVSQTTHAKRQSS